MCWFDSSPGHKLMYYVYVLRNKVNHHRYIGHCKNIPERLKD
ncbi:MAG: GIY-YIG nuclease family protein, partial [Fidelibacterota bacterium]